MRLRGRPGRRGPDPQPADQDAELGLPARDQRDQANAGRLPEHPRRPRRFLRLPNRRRSRRGGLAGRDRRGHRPHLVDDCIARARRVRAVRARRHRRAGASSPTHAPAIALGAGDARGPSAQPAGRAAESIGEVRLRDRLPRALARHRLRLLLGAGRHPFIAGYPLFSPGGRCWFCRSLSSSTGFCAGGRSDTSSVASGSIPGTTASVSSATCSPTGRSSRRPPCAATSSTWPGPSDVGNSVAAPNGQAESRDRSAAAS